jgi:hypothetical protein
MENFSTFATVIAAWLGAVGTIWQIYQSRRLGYRVKVKVSPSFTVDGEGKVMQDFLAISVRNIGTSSVDITNWAIRLPDGSNFVHFQQENFSAKLPHTLKSGTEATYYCDLPELRNALSQRSMKSKKIKAEVSLATGKKVLSKKLRGL